MLGEEYPESLLIWKGGTTSFFSTTNFSPSKEWDNSVATIYSLTMSTVKELTVRKGQSIARSLTKIAGISILQDTKKGELDENFSIQVTLFSF